MRGHWLLTFALCLMPLAGCSTSGGSSVLIPKTNKLMKAAEMAALTAKKYAPLPRELQKQPLEAYYVQPGDVLLLEVIDLEAAIRLPADQTVMPDGSIDLGSKYGRPVVAGMTIEQIEAVVHSAVQTVESEVDVKPINVRLMVAESAVYYVLGEVNAPGSYPLIGRETVLDAILAAGGLSDRASDCEIILSRPTPPCNCRVVLPVCYNRIVQLGDTTTNYQIQPGDRIYVATRTLCEQLRFWSSKCKFCPSCCDHGCPSPLISPPPPFIISGPPLPGEVELLYPHAPPLSSDPTPLPTPVDDQ